MDYINKYLKYKKKYINLKNMIYGGDKCDKNFQLPLDFKFNDIDYKIYSGSIDIQNQIEDPCDLDDLYAKCKVYLDTLNNYQQFILWTYTGGALARLLNNYLLKDKNYKKIDISIISYSILFQIRWYFLYMIDKIEQAADLKLLFEKIILFIFDNIKSINKYLRNPNYKLDKEDNQTLNNILSIINNLPKQSDKSRKINALKDFFINANNKYIIEQCIIYVLEEDDSIISEYIKINLDELQIILKGVPPIDRCIRLYKIIGKNNDLYEVGKKYKQIVINSLTCSRSANISIFYDRDKNICCLLDIICKAGTKILFLDYTKTAYGNKMYEVILPPDYYFNILSSEKKSIMTYEFTEKNIKLKDYSQLKPIYDIIYKNPVVKEIKTYLIEIDDK
jgi:hypothetical protein